MQAGAAEVGVHEQDLVAVVGEDDGKVEHGGGLAFASAAADDDQAVGLGVLAREHQVGAQDAIGFGVRTVHALVEERADILRNDAEHRGLEGLLDVVDGLHAGVEVLDEEGETDAHDHAHDHAEGDVERDVGAGGLAGKFRRIGDLDHRGPRHGHLDVFLLDLDLEGVAHPFQLLHLADGGEVGVHFFGGLTIIDLGFLDRAGEHLIPRFGGRQVGVFAAQNAVHAIGHLGGDFFQQGIDAQHLGMLRPEVFALRGEFLNRQGLLLKERGEQFIREHGLDDFFDFVPWNFFEGGQLGVLFDELQVRGVSQRVEVAQGFGSQVGGNARAFGRDDGDVGALADGFDGLLLLADFLLVGLQFLLEHLDAADGHVALGVEAVVAIHLGELLGNLFGFGGDFTEDADFN